MMIFRQDTFMLFLIFELFTVQSGSSQEITQGRSEYFLQLPY